MNIHLISLAFIVSSTLLLPTGCKRAESPSPARHNYDLVAGRIGSTTCIVSLAPNLTEILFALGLENRICGVTRYCNYPPAAQKIPRVGGFIDPSIETILSLKPDLIVAAKNVGNRERVLQLEKMGIPVFYSQFHTIEDIITTITRLGSLTKTEKAAQSLVNSMREDLRHLQTALHLVTPVKTLLVFSTNPLIVAGPGSFGHQLVVIAGGQNIASDSSAAYPRMSFEAVIEKAPHVILDATMDAEEDPRAFWSRFPTIPAVQSGRIHAINADELLRPGPRLGHGLRRIARLLHPGMEL